MTRDEPWTPQQHDYNHDEQWYDTIKDKEHDERSRAVPHDQPDIARNHQGHSSAAWTQAEEAEMLRLSSLGYYPNLSGNTRHNFVFKMKSDGRLKCRTTMGNAGISIAYDVGSSELGLRDNFTTEVLKDIGFLQCSSMPDAWTRMISDRLDRVVIYCDDLIITSWNPELLKDIITIKHDTNPMKYKSPQYIE